MINKSIMLMKTTKLLVGAKYELHMGDSIKSTKKRI